MDTDAKTFFQSFFSELERRGVPYVVLHSYQNFPDRMDSDVDYAVRDADIPKAHAILEETAARTGWLLAQTLQYDIGSHYSVVVNPARPGTFLKLDRCSHYTRNGCLFIRDEALLAGRKKFNGFHIPSASSEFIYMLVKVFAKGKDITGFLPRLRELSAAEPQRSEELFHEVFGPEAGALADWFKRPPAVWQQLSQPMHALNRYRAPQRLLEWRRRARRFLQPTGLSIAVVGTDREAVDKLVGRIETLEEPCFRRQLKMHFSLCDRERLSSYWFRELPAIRRSTLVISTALLDELPKPVLLPWLPKPDLIFQLGDGPDDADPRFIVLPADDLEKAAASAWRKIAVFLSERNARRSHCLVHKP